MLGTMMWFFSDLKSCNNALFNSVIVIGTKAWLLRTSLFPPRNWTSHTAIGSLVGMHEKRNLWLQCVAHSVEHIHSNLTFHSHYLVIHYYAIFFEIISIEKIKSKKKYVLFWCKYHGFSLPSTQQYSTSLFFCSSLWLPFLVMKSNGFNSWTIYGKWFEWSWLIYVNLFILWWIFFLKKWKCYLIDLMRNKCCLIWLQYVIKTTLKHLFTN